MNIKKMNHKLGFSLLELTIAMVIIGTIIAATLPMLDTKRIKNDVGERFALDIKYIEDANKNFILKYVDPVTGDTNKFGLLNPPDSSRKSLIDTNYVINNISNPFYSSGPNSKINEQIVSNSGVDDEYKISFNVPKDIVGVFENILPNVQRGAVNGDVITLTSTIKNPVINSNNNNLMHRDSGVHQELRTSHGPILITDNVTPEHSKLVITNDYAENPQNIIADNGYVKTDKSAITIGVVGGTEGSSSDPIKVGIKGADKNGDIYIDAINQVKTGNKLVSGTVKIGLQQITPSDPTKTSGVELGVDNRELLQVNKKGTSFIGYKDNLNDTSQIVSVINENGQVWTNKKNNDEIKGAVTQDGSFVSNQGFGVIDEVNDNSLTSGTNSWDHIYKRSSLPGSLASTTADLNPADTNRGIENKDGKSIGGVIKAKRVTNYDSNDNPEYSGGKLNPGTDSILYLGSVKNGVEDIGYMSKHPYGSLLTIGSIMRMRAYHITGNANDKNFIDFCQNPDNSQNDPAEPRCKQTDPSVIGTPCANGTGKIKAVIYSISGYGYGGNLSDLYVSGNNITDRSIKGVNSYIEERSSYNASAEKPKIGCEIFYNGEWHSNLEENSSDSDGIDDSDKIHCNILAGLVCGDK